MEKSCIRYSCKPDVIVLITLKIILPLRMAELNCTPCPYNILVAV
jgi:hypothetical protein